MARKSFSDLLLMGRTVFLPCCLTRGQTMVEVLKTTVTAFKRSHPCTAPLSAPNPAAAIADPRFCWRLLGTNVQACLSPLWGHCSFLPNPVAHKICLCPPRVLFKFWGLYSGVNVNLF